MIFLIPFSYAQKKEISQAQEFIKSRKSLDKAEESMRKLLKDSVNRSNIKIYLTLAEAVRAQYEQGNEKLYLKEKYDTAALFITAHKMFEAYESLDSVDARPNEKGVVKIKYSKRNAEYLNTCRNNLYNGGMYFALNKKCDTAYRLMDTFIDCVRQPLFSGCGYREDAPLNKAAAYFTLYCGYKMQDPAKALKYETLALQYDKRHEFALRFVAEVYNMKKDTANYVAMLTRGFNEYKDSPYFFTRLMDYYNGVNKLDSAFVTVESALAHNPGNELFLFAKSNVLLNTGDYEGCIAVCDSLIARNDTLADAYYDAGVAYINMAFNLEKTVRASKATRTKLLSYYRKALPYMERYRALAPEQKDKWMAALYNIYLNLNMGAQFEEIDRMIRNS
ncbi:tetratricopeptide repeat protein [Xylanibacter caecicola]|uniref:tetratricopeptide repeat protein n=1 Tax=Xylanibacter caecicola TaxID=2736294 RepID=UPI0025886BBB|nr:hypothetical protein [Xylanibacter caecicola]